MALDVSNSVQSPSFEKSTFSFCGCQRSTAISLIAFGIIFMAAGFGVGLSTNVTDVSIGMTSLGYVGIALFLIGLYRIYKLQSAEQLVRIDPPERTSVASLTQAESQQTIIDQTATISAKAAPIQYKQRQLKLEFFIKFLEEMNIKDARKRSFPIVEMPEVGSRRQNEFIIQQVAANSSVPKDQISLIETDNDADSLYFPKAGVLIRAWEWDGYDCIRTQTVQNHSLNGAQLSVGNKNQEKNVLRDLISNDI